MQFVLQTLSLEHLAGVKIVAHLWSQRDIFTQIKAIFNLDPFYSLNGEMIEWMAIERRVKRNVWALQLPKLCKRQLRYLIKPLGMELLAWCNCYCVDEGKEHFLDTMLPQQLCWTMHGRLDYRRTAEALIKDERVDIESRYEMACVHCLETSARKLFRRMGAERRQGYISKVRKMKRLVHQCFLTYFTCNLLGDAHGVHSFLHLIGERGNTFRVLFQHALCYGDRAACEYFFNKLSRREKREVLEDKQLQSTIFGDSRASSWLYYMSLMNEEQRQGMFRECTGDLLISLLGWPLQSLFMEAVQCGWSYMNEEIYSDVLERLTRRLPRRIPRRIPRPIRRRLPRRLGPRRITQNFLDFDYSPLFWEFWRLSPAEHKHYFLNNVYNLSILIESKEEEIMQLAVNEAPSHLLKQLGLLE